MKPYVLTLQTLIEVIDSISEKKPKLSQNTSNFSKPVRVIYPKLQFLQNSTKIEK